jgi:hypothetical protein
MEKKQTPIMSKMSSLRTSYFSSEEGKNSLKEVDSVSSTSSRIENDKVAGKTAPFSKPLKS